MRACLLTGRNAKNPVMSAENGLQIYKLKKPASFNELQDTYRSIIYPHYISGTPAVFAVEDPDKYFSAVLSIHDPPPVGCPLTAEKVVRHLQRLPRVDDISKARFPQAKGCDPVEIGMKLDAEQAQAAAHYLGPALVIAPAGSGKTTTLTARVVMLIKRRIKPERVLCLTFTKKAAQEMRERLARELGEPGKAVTVKTYHALAYQLIAEFEGRVPSLITDRYRVLRELMFEDTFNYKISVEDADSFISLQLNSLTPPGIAKADSDSQWQMKRLYQAYWEYLEKHRLYDQDFLLMKLYEMLRSDPKKRHALMDYAGPSDPPGYPKGRWHFVLVDEVQDNNLAQDVLTRFLTPWDNVFFVGDEDQLLYTFRGSDIKRILNLEKSYPQLKEMHLKTNYRCRPEIVKAADRMIRKNVLRRDKDIVAYREEAEGAVKAKFFTSAGAEYEWVAQEIKALTDSGTKPGEIAVLYRINVQGDAVATCLKDKDIPHYVHRDGKSLFQYSEVEALLNHLVLVLPEFRNTQEFKAALLKSLVVPKRTDRVAGYESALAETPDGDPMAVITKTSVKLDDEKVQEFCYQLLNMSLLRMPNAGLVVAYVREKFIESWYGSEAESERLDIIESIASKFRSAADFVRWVNRTKLNGKKDKNGDSVQLMTVHGAKGLEFPVVFLVNCTEGYFPYARSVEEGNLEEERRVFYVGMTRARDVLYLSGYADKKKGLSRFLLDAGIC